MYMDNNYYVLNYAILRSIIDSIAKNMDRQRPLLIIARALQSWLRSGHAWQPRKGTCVRREFVVYSKRHSTSARPELILHKSSNC